MSTKLYLSHICANCVHCCGVPDNFQHHLSCELTLETINLYDEGCRDFTKSWFIAAYVVVMALFKNVKQGDKL